MNNKKTYRVGLLLLVVSLISTVMLSGTFARYTSEYVGSDTALVAKWDLNMDKNGIINVDNSEQAMDLFSHLYNQNLVTGSGTEKIIAPGVGGSFNLKVTNNSDVAAAINFKITEPADTNATEPADTNAAVPMEFSSTDAAIYVSLNDLNAYLNNAEDPVYTLGAGTTETKIILWRWNFEDSTVHGGAKTDATDTTLGKASASAGENARTEYKLIVTATAKQVAPTSPTP